MHVRLRQWFAGLSCLLLIAFAVIGPPALAITSGDLSGQGIDASGWTKVEEAGVNSATAEQSSGSNQQCDGITGIPFGTDPGWVRVGGSPATNAPFAEARGQILFRPSSDFFKNQSFVTWTDNPANHSAHDLNVFLSLDKAYRHLLSNGSFFSTYSNNEHGKLEIEWERSGVPTWAYPSDGDRATVWGAHVFDCGHGDDQGDDVAESDLYRTEIHPPVGWVLYRNTADRDGVVDNEAKRTQDPWNWYGPSDRFGTGEVLPGTGLLNTPTRSTIADAFFSSYGGNIPESLNGCDNDDGDVPCTQENEWFQNLTQQNYTFFIPAPPKPAGPQALIWEAQDRCNANGFTVPNDPSRPPADDVDDVGEDDVSPVPSGPTCGIDEDVIETTDANGDPGIQVTVKASEAPLPANRLLNYAKRFKVAWDHVPPQGEHTRVFRVNFNTLRVYNDSEPCGEDGEWVLQFRANEGWIYPVRGSGDDGDPFWADGAVNDELCDILDPDKFRDYGIGDALTVSVPDGETLQVWSRGRETDTVANDFIPVVQNVHNPDDVDGGGTFNFAPRSVVLDPCGFPTDDCDPADYALLYSITEITKPAPTLGTLTIGDPRYGPNADTGGSATRVSGLTPIELTGSNGTRLQYRFYAEDATPPTGWSYDDAAPFKIDLPGAGAADGFYIVEYAPVSADGIVAQRRTTPLQLDTVPPNLTVPADFTVNATSAQGAVVNYTATASDNLPGPVDVSCSPPSGSLFPAGKNAPQTTTVTCKATDPVGNSVTKSFNVTVESPHGYLPDFAILGTEWVQVGSSVVVESGNLGAFTTSPGPEGDGFEIVTGSSNQFKNGSKIAAHSVALGSDNAANEVYTVDKITVGAGTTHTPKLGFVPLFLGMPAVPAAGPGGTNFTASGTQTLPPGDYGNVLLQFGSKLTLSGGTYRFSSLDMRVGASLLAAGPSTIIVAGRAKLAGTGTIGPAPGSGVLARQIVMYVRGTDSSTDRAFQTGGQAKLTMNIFVPNGTLFIGANSTATGAFLGRRLSLGSFGVYTLDSSFVTP